MKLLIIGGSYFLGRWFVQLAHDKHELFVVNRGNLPIPLTNVNQIVADRHDLSALDKIPRQEYDCVVDFCAYEPNDIQIIFDVLGKYIKNYIYISTVDVYPHGTKQIHKDSEQYESREIDGQEGHYIKGKVALEKELVFYAKQYGINFTSVRPSIIYGPGNYAPRESIFFQWIQQAGQVLYPVDATGKFQLIYVEDVAKALLALCETESYQWKRCYNICPKSAISYQEWMNALQTAIPVKFEQIPISVEQIISQQIPMPFALTEEESHICDNENYHSLNLEETPLEVGLRKEWNVL